jgi:hypothetical protein
MNLFFKTMKSIRQILSGLLLTLVLISTSIAPAWAFCGFYVGGANAQLFNKASQVIIAHKDDKTILTMANDFQGNVKDFAMVVPVPVLIKREQVHIGEKEIITKLDAFSQPRLVEYFDEDPCPRPLLRPMPSANVVRSGRYAKDRFIDANALGVKIEDSFQVGEYNIAILSARDSDGLETWLKQNNYQLPSGASAVLQPYVRQQMKFFVAKVNLAELNKTGSSLLRPLQIAYKSPKFMLPIRLGMLNAQGDQDLVAYILSPKGRVQVANYRTIEVPSSKEIPEFVKEDFGKFYKSTFQRSYEQANKKVVFLEYAWDVSNCDPCTTTPPESEELKKAGVFWQEDGGSTYITRLHVRYSRDKFPEDLVFQETSNQENFQGRYIMRHPYRKRITCGTALAENYRKSVVDRQQQEARTLAGLTGWPLSEIQGRIQPVEVYTNDRDTPFWPW